MKIWHTTSAEHSAALKIVGTFNREEDAQAAEALLKEMIQTATEAAVEVQRLEDLEFGAKPIAGVLPSERARKQKWREAQGLYKLDGFVERDFYDLSGPETTVEPSVGNRLEIGTDEWTFQGLIAVLLARGATIEIERY